MRRDAQSVRCNGETGVHGTATRHERGVDHKEIVQIVCFAVAIENVHRGVIAESARTARVSVVHGEFRGNLHGSPWTDMTLEFVTQ